MVAVALPWFVLQTTGSVVQMGLAGAVVGIGTLFSSISGGPLVDRFGFRRASIVSDVAAGAAVAAVPLLFWADVLPFWLLLVLAFLISVLNAPGDLARRALVPTLAGWAAMPLERANAADTAIPRLSQLVGPLIGGILVAVAGAPTVLLLDAATFLLSAAAVAVAVPSYAQVDDNRRTQRSDAHGHQIFADSRLMRSPARQYLFELREGFRFVRTSGLLISLIVIATVASLLEKPLMSVVAPVYAQDYYGSAASFGAMLSAFGAGALAGTLAFSVVGPRLPRRLTFLGCLILAPVILFGSLATTPPLAALLVALARVWSDLRAHEFPVRDRHPGDRTHGSPWPGDRYGHRACDGRGSVGGHGRRHYRGQGGAGRHARRDGRHLPGPRGRDGLQPGACARWTCVGSKRDVRRPGIDVPAEPTMAAAAPVILLVPPQPPRAGADPVVGGANSAGQAALHLARYASHVTLLVRGSSLEKSMSQYLIEEIRATANLTVRLGTQVVDAHGNTRLEGLVVEDVDSRRREELVAHGLFVLIGAEPRTEWLPNIGHDDHGFLLTGPDVAPDNAPPNRPLFPFETSLPASSLQATSGTDR